MHKTQKYEGISRKKYPDWIGWVIIDDIEKCTRTVKEIHLIEILNQLKYEVKFFKFNEIWHNLNQHSTKQ
jgi:hypothetical protein